RGDSLWKITRRREREAAAHTIASRSDLRLHDVALRAEELQASVDVRLHVVVRYGRNEFRKPHLARIGVTEELSGFWRDVLAAAVEEIGKQNEVTVVRDLLGDVEHRGANA